MYIPSLVPTCPGEIASKGEAAYPAVLEANAWCPAIDWSAHDLIGQNNGTMTGSVSPLATDRGVTWDFDGTNDYIDIGDLKQTAPATVTVWFYPTTVNDRRLLTQGSGATTQAGGFGINTISTFFLVRAWSGSAWLTLSAAQALNEWYCLSMVYTSGGSVESYINGLATGYSETCDFDFSGPSAYIGGKFTGSFGNRFFGQIGLLSITPRELSTGELFSVFEGTRDRFAKGFRRRDMPLTYTEPGAAPPASTQSMLTLLGVG